MSEEKITVTLTEEEYIKHVVKEVIADEDISELATSSPTIMLLIPIITKNVWDNLAKYSRMQQVADVLTNTKED